MIKHPAEGQCAPGGRRRAADRLPRRRMAGRHM